MMPVAVWSAVVSAVYAVIAFANADLAQVLVVAFIALLIVPATMHLIRKSHDLDDGR